MPSDLEAKITRSLAQASKNAPNAKLAERMQAQRGSGGSPSSPSNDVLAQLQSAVARLEDENKGLRDEIKSSRGHFHQAGQIDNDTLRKAVLYDELQKTRADEGRGAKPDLDDDVKELLDQVDGKNRALIGHLSSEAIRNDPEIKELINDLRELKKREERREKEAANERMVQYQADLDLIQEYLDDEMFTPQINAKIKSLFDRGETLMDAASMALKRDLSKDIQEAKKKREAKPPPKSREVHGNITEEVTEKPRSMKDAFEMARAKAADSGHDLTFEEFVGLPNFSRSGAR